VLSLKVPPKRPHHNRGTESDDDVDENGVIYEQVMRRNKDRRNDEIFLRDRETMVQLLLVIN